MAHDDDNDDVNDDDDCRSRMQHPYMIQSLRVRIKGINRVLLSEFDMSIINFRSLSTALSTLMLKRPYGILIIRC